MELIECHPSRKLFKEGVLTASVSYYTTKRCISWGHQHPFAESSPPTPRPWNFCRSLCLWGSLFCGTTRHPAGKSNLAPICSIEYWNSHRPSSFCHLITPDACVQLRMRSPTMLLLVLMPEDSTSKCQQAWIVQMHWSLVDSHLLGVVHKRPHQFPLFTDQAQTGLGT